MEFFNFLLRIPIKKVSLPVFMEKCMSFHCSGTWKNALSPHPVQNNSIQKSVTLTEMEFNRTINNVQRRNKNKNVPALRVSFIFGINLQNCHSLLVALHGDHGHIKEITNAFTISQIEEVIFLAWRRAQSDQRTIDWNRRWNMWGLQALMAQSMKMTAFWDIAPVL